jgi:hypothetical protein
VRPALAAAAHGTQINHRHCDPPLAKENWKETEY